MLASLASRPAAAARAHSRGCLAKDRPASAPAPARAAAGACAETSRSSAFTRGQLLRLSTLALRRRGDVMHRPGSRRLACAAAAALALPSLDAMFGAASAVVMPLYGLMLAAPKWHVTIKLMQSPGIFLAYAALYTVLLVQSWQADTLALMFSPRGLSLPSLTGIAEMFLRPASAAAYWVHLLCLDLFVARHVFLDGVRLGIPTRLPLVLTMLFGPIGLLAHLCLRAVSGGGVSAARQRPAGGGSGSALAPSAAAAVAAAAAGSGAIGRDGAVLYSFVSEPQQQPPRGAEGASSADGGGSGAGEEAFWATIRGRPGLGRGGGGGGAAGPVGKGGGDGASVLGGGGGGADGGSGSSAGNTLN